MLFLSGTWPIICCVQSAEVIWREMVEKWCGNESKIAWENCAWFFSGRTDAKKCGVKNASYYRNRNKILCCMCVGTYRAQLDHSACVSPWNMQQYCAILKVLDRWVKLVGTMRSTCQYCYNYLYRLLRHIGNVLCHCFECVSQWNMQWYSVILPWIGEWSCVVPWGAHLNITTTVYTTCYSTLAMC